MIASFVFFENYKDDKKLVELLLSPLSNTGKVKSLLITHNSWFLNDIAHLLAKWQSAYYLLFLLLLYESELSEDLRRYIPTWIVYKYLEEHALRVFLTLR